MSERVIASLMLIASVYGGVWAVLEKPSLILVFALLIVASAITVSVVWADPVIAGE